MTNQRSSDLTHVAKIPDRMREFAEELHKPIIREFEKDII